jgi:Fe-S-cluster containining protein
MDTAGMDLHFECTQCGKCCRNLKLPLTVFEAMEWLQTGKTVQVICEALPWPEEPPAEDLKAAHRRRRSFATMSGSLPVRVIVILAADLGGRCPHLQDDMRCGIYATRPLVCCIYPAEINPFTQLDPARKVCPPEAWTTDRPLIQRDGRIVDQRIRENIRLSRDADANTTEIKRRMCAELKLNHVALADEGFVLYSPDRAALLGALVRAVEGPLAQAEQSAGAPCHFISNQPETVDSLVIRGAAGSLVRQGDQAPYEYLGFRSAGN